MSTKTVAGNPAMLSDAGHGPVSDLELVNQSKSGDPEAFSELVRRHQHVVFNVSYRFMRDSALAEDMAQEAFLKAYRLLKGFRGDCSFSTWMYRVTCSVCLTELNRRKRRNEVEQELQYNVETSEEPVENPDMPEMIRRCVRRLPDRYVQIITLYYLKGVSYEEIAQVMNIPMGTLKTWMFRARKQLRGVVEQEMNTNAN
jgi:RNA polymerase sigma-70 factor (ECF subfamily)